MMPLDIRAVFAKMGFSVAEIRIIAGVMHAMKTVEIAAAFKTSPEFVTATLEKIYNKLWVKNRAELVIKLIQMNAFRGFQPRIGQLKSLNEAA